MRLQGDENCICANLTFVHKMKHAAFDTCWLHLQIMLVPLLCFRDCEVEIEVVAFSESFEYVYSC